jgi:hypothetical protein
MCNPWLSRFSRPMPLASARARWAAYRQAKTNERLSKALLGEVIERLVQESLPSIRRVGGYRQQLLAPIETRSICRPEPAAF